LISINPYDKEKCQEIVEQNYLTKIHEISGTSAFLFYDFSFLLESTKYDSMMEYHLKYFKFTTPRENLCSSVFSCVPFYYLDIATAKNPTRIVDIGCGFNVFSKLMPNVHGIDPYTAECDEKAEFNDVFAAAHSQAFECAFSIDAIHFISLTEFKRQVELFASTIKSGGRGMLAMNAGRMIEHTTDSERLDLFGTTTPTPKQIEEYIDKELSTIDLNFLVLENFVSECLDEWLDGNIRMVFEV
jgi:hypothetical protein